MIRDILVRAAQRAAVPVVFVANHALGIPQSAWARSVQVDKGFDVADNYIVQQVTQDDLVVTSDIPLAAEVIELGAQVITSRGEKYTRNNVRQRLNMRDFMETMRSSAVEVGGGPPALHARDRQEFANALDSYLAKYAR